MIRATEAGECERIIEEIGELLAGPASCATDCDGCHQDAPVYPDPCDEPGEWMYCARCLRKKREIWRRRLAQLV